MTNWLVKLAFYLSAVGVMVAAAAVFLAVIGGVMSKNLKSDDYWVAAVLVVLGCVFVFWIFYTIKTWRVLRKTGWTDRTQKLKHGKAIQT